MPAVATRWDLMPLYVRTLLLTGPIPEIEALLGEHLEHLRELRNAGRLFAAGRLGHGDGFLEIFEAKDLLEAEETARATPLVRDGLGAWSLREWERLDV